MHPRLLLQLDVCLGPVVWCLTQRKHPPRRALGHFTLLKPQDSCAPWSIRHPSRRHRCLSRHLPVMRLPNPSSRPLSHAVVSASNEGGN
ncbi:hypothetical protein B0J13DRAFT_53043 [Dactylonectria estremocensis]|uniref:Secreted protein n=1 Tax=Dactylonectria estremocensis TaxID=1079267 RepID=A0A9P9J2T8_9HYPO|nr:hypothetical protein B0J13DRAFT_53043 [Dactylonectria estremocensis]